MGNLILLSRVENEEDQSSDLLFFPFTASLDGLEVHNPLTDEDAERMINTMVQSLVCAVLQLEETSEEPKGKLMKDVIDAMGLLYADPSHKLDIEDEES